MVINGSCSCGYAANLYTIEKRKKNVVDVVKVAILVPLLRLKYWSCGLQFKIMIHVLNLILNHFM